MAQEIAALVAAGRRAPCLAVVLVGDDPASVSYIKGKRRACERVGMASREHKLPADTRAGRPARADRRAEPRRRRRRHPRAAAAAEADRAERDRSAIDPAKDVDGVAPAQRGRSCSASRGLVPCTPLGILEILDRHGIALAGAHAVVIGRSIIVGKPVSLLLQQRNATVTMCHSRTRDLARALPRAPTCSSRPSACRAW